MTAFAEIENGTGRVIQQIGRADPPDFEGPPAPAPDWGANSWRMLAADLDWRSRPTGTSILSWPVEAGEPFWVEAASLADTVATVRDSIDRKAGLARMSVLIEPTKLAEYRRAEDAARPYRDAGYPDPAPEPVDSWAWAKRHRNGGVPWTGQQAADDIIAQADRYYGLLDGIRRLRLDAMELCLAIGEAPDGTHAQVLAAEAQFDLDLANLMKGPA